MSKYHIVGNHVTAQVQTFISGRAGVLGGARPKVVQQVPSKGVQIYSDENSDPSLLPPQAGEWTAVPHRNKINKENEKKPGQWTKAKVEYYTVISCLFVVKSKLSPNHLST